MSDERITKKETDFWGNEKEVIYEGGKKVGEIHVEQRGGFFGIGGEDVRVERDTRGAEVGYSKTEDRGGLFGFGATPTEVRYDPSGKETGTSRIEERGGFLGLGAEHVRVHRDNEGNETAESRWEDRGGFFGVGAERVRVTRPSGRYNPGKDPAEGHSHGSGGGGGYAAGRSSSSGSGWGILVAVFGAILMFAYLADSRRPVPRVEQPRPAPAPVRVDPREEEASLRLAQTNWATVQFALLHAGFDPGIPAGSAHAETRMAIEAWQRSIGHTATGYLSRSEHDRLRDMARRRMGAISIATDHLRKLSWDGSGNGCGSARIRIVGAKEGILTMFNSAGIEADAVIIRWSGWEVTARVFRASHEAVIGDVLRITNVALFLESPKRGIRASLRACRR